MPVLTAAERVCADTASKVPILQDDVIYRLLDSMAEHLAARLEPVVSDKVESTAVVGQIFELGGAAKGQIVAGSQVSSGVFTTANTVRVRIRRDDEIVADGVRVASLRRFRDTANQVQAGEECGIVLEGHSDVRAGDVLELYGQVTSHKSLKPQYQQ